MKYLLVFAIMLYWAVQGIIEGWIWASPERRMSNRIICGNVGTGAKGVLDYHAYRMIEVGSIFLAILSAWLYSGNSFIFIVIGAWFTGVFIYERLLNWVTFRKLFPDKGKFDLMGYKFPAGNTRDFIYLGIGMLAFIVVLLNRG